MNFEWFGIQTPGKIAWVRLAERFDQVKAKRQEAAIRVLGHPVDDADWLIFDDVLSEEYDRMVKLLRLLDERAG
jgi:hypothetical protein